MKKLISGALVVLIGLMSFSVAFAATSMYGTGFSFTIADTNVDVTVDDGGETTKQLTISQATGSDVIYDLSTSLTLAGTTVTFQDPDATDPTADVTSVTVESGVDKNVNYKIVVDSGIVAVISQTFNMLVDDPSGTNQASLAMTLTIPSDDSRVITEASLSEIVIRSGATTTNSVTLTATVQNTGNENVVVSQTLGSLANAVTENTYFNLNDLILNWNNEKSLSVSSTTITLPTTGINSNTITPDNSQEFIITIPTASTDKYGVYTGTLSLMDDGTTPVSKDTAPISVEIVDTNNDETLIINDGTKDGKVEDKSGDDNKIYPGDKIVIKDITIDNEVTYVNINGQVVAEDLENIVVTVTIYNSQDGSEVVDEFEFDDFDLRDGREESFDYDFQLPFDITEDTYVITYLVQAEGKDSGNQYSNRAYDTFEVEQDSRHLVIEEFDFAEYCPGETAEVKIKIANIGTRDLDKDDNIKVNLDIGKFDFDETQTWSKDFDKEDSESFTFSVDIPSTASGPNLLEISVSHDGDKDAEDDGSSLAQTYTIASDCSPVSGASGTDVKGTITGVLTSTGTLGESTSYALLLYNTGSSSATYTIEVSGVSGWGTSLVEPTAGIFIASGEFSTFYVHLTPSESASESNSAVITVKSGSEIIDTKTLTMNVEKSSSSTYTNALLGSTFAELGESEDLITLFSLAIILLVSFGTVYTALQGNGTPAKKNRKTKKERK